MHAYLWVIPACVVMVFLSLIAWAIMGHDDGE